MTNVQINLMIMFGCKFHAMGCIKIQCNLLKDSNSIFVSFLKS